MSSKSRRTTPTRYDIAGRINAIGRSKAREAGAARFIDYQLPWDHDTNFFLPEIGDPGIQYVRPGNTRRHGCRREYSHAYRIAIFLAAGGRYESR
jgi:hypothetical protein